MKSITFTCTLSAEVIKKLVHQRESILRVSIWLLLIGGTTLLYLLFPDNGIHDIILLLLYLLILVIFLFFIFLHGIN